MVRRVPQSEEEIDDKDDAHPQLEGHIGAVVQKILVSEGVVRDKDHQSRRQGEHTDVEPHVDVAQGAGKAVNGGIRL